MKQETNSYNLIFNKFTSSLFPSNSEKEKLPSNNNFNLYQKDSFAVKLTYRMSIFLKFCRASQFAKVSSSGSIFNLVFHTHPALAELINMIFSISNNNKKNELTHNIPMKI